MNILKIFLPLILVVSSISFVQAEENFVVGKDYEITGPDVNSEPLIEEFFNYACGACYSMEAFITDFKQKNPNIKFKGVPLELNPSWKIYVKAYYIGEKLGVLDKSHSLIFHRIHVEKKYFKDDADMKNFFLSIGVDEKAYDDVANSYWLNTNMKLSKEYAMKNKVMGTPTLLINKRYKLNNKSLGTIEKISQAMVELSGVEVK